MEQERSSTKMTLKLSGITGYSGEKYLTDPIDILAWSWGLSQGNIQALSFTKYVENNSPHLMKLVADHRKIDKVELTAVNDSKLVYTMRNVFVTHMATGGSGGEYRLTENVSIYFESIEITYAENKENPTTVAISTLQNGSAAQHGGASQNTNDGLFNILEDVCNSFALAMQSEGISEETRHAVCLTVEDYIANNYGDD
jgi:type VI secretion system secreted protein Hcp